MYLPGQLFLTPLPQKYSFLNIYSYIVILRAITNITTSEQGKPKDIALLVSYTTGVQSSAIEIFKTYRNINTSKISQQLFIYLKMQNSMISNLYKLLLMGKTKNESTYFCKV